MNGTFLAWWFIGSVNLKACSGFKTLLRHMRLFPWTVKLWNIKNANLGGEKLTPSDIPFFSNKLKSKKIFPRPWHWQPLSKRKGFDAFVGRQGKSDLGKPELCVFTGGQLVYWTWKRRVPQRNLLRASLLLCPPRSLRVGQATPKQRQCTFYAAVLAAAGSCLLGMPPLLSWWSDAHFLFVKPCP